MEILIPGILLNKKMISNELQFKFHLLEMMAFEEYKKASPKEKEKIVSQLGRFEADEIIKEIEEKARLL